MTIEEQLRNYIVTKYGTITKFGEKVGLSQSTLSTIFKRGIQRTSITRIFLICDELGISADALALGKIVPKAEYGKKRVEIESAFNMMRDTVTLSIDDIPITDFEYYLLLHNVNLTVEVLKERRQEIERTTGKKFEDISDVDVMLLSQKDLDEDFDDDFDDESEGEF